MLAVCDKKDTTEFPGALSYTFHLITYPFLNLYHGSPHRFDQLWSTVVSLNG